jgi:non-ribosomal peptide synthetase component F
VLASSAQSVTRNYVGPQVEEWSRLMTEDFRPVTEQISEISARYPDRVALSANERQLSYRELDSRVGRLAGYLAESFDWVVAALAIMRAGAAYIPLDSAWPDARLRLAIDDSGATVLLGRAALLDCLAVKARCIGPCRDAAAIAAAVALKSTPVSPESLAYVIYTSGSTGSLKGVEITHSNLARLMQCTGMRLGLQGRIARVILRGLDLTPLFGSCGHIFPLERLCAWQTMQCAPHPS